jgi:hypothetical protein
MSETPLSLLVSATPGGGGGSGSGLTSASNGLLVSGTVVQLGGFLTGNTFIDGQAFAYNIRFEKLNNFQTLSNFNEIEVMSGFTVKNLTTGLVLINSQAGLNSIALVGAAQDRTPVKFQGGFSDGRQILLDNPAFTPISPVEFNYDVKDNEGTLSIQDFSVSTPGEFYAISLPEAVQEIEGREINIYYGNLQTGSARPDFSIFNGSYVNGDIILDYAGRGIDFSQGRDNHWKLKVIQKDTSTFIWSVISIRRLF